MKKILFYTANGVGLGHVRRSSLIAKSILESGDSKVFFASMCTDASFLDELNISYQKLIPVSDRIVKDYTENQRCKKLNEQKLLEVIENFKPDKIVLDIHVFANYSFPDTILSDKCNSIEKILIYRMTNKKSFVFNFEKFEEKFKIFDKIIIPHSKGEINRSLSKSDYEKCVKNDIISFSGPIFRKLDKKVLGECKKRYNLSEKNFNITIALGGGGELKKGQCETPATIILNFLNSFNSLIKLYPNIKITLVTGPLFKHKKLLETIEKVYVDALKIVKFENNLMELFSLSDLVISPVGYNAGNEIIEAKTPAILIPLLRGEDNGQEQMERAKYLESFGFVNVYDLNGRKEFKDIIKNSITDLKKMKKAFDNFPKIKLGNIKSAKIILN